MYKRSPFIFQSNVSKNRTWRRTSDHNLKEPKTQETSFFRKYAVWEYKYIVFSSLSLFSKNNA